MLSVSLRFLIISYSVYSFKQFFKLKKASNVAVNYMKNTNFMLLGGLTVAIAIETSQLHRRIALGTLKIIGSSPRRLMFGFMFISWFLSMWIANTAAAAMMIPIVLAVLEELERNEEDTGVENPSFEVSLISGSKSEFLTLGLGRK